MPLRFVALVSLLPFVLGGILFRPIWGVYLFVSLFYLSPQSFIWGVGAFRIPLLVAVTTLIASFRLPAPARPTFPKQMLVLWVFLGVALLSALFAEGSFEIAQPELELLLKTGIFCLLLCRVVRSVVDIEHFMWISLTAALPLALWGFQQYHAGNYRLERVGGGQLMDSTSLSAAFIFLIPFALFNAGETRAWKRLLAWVSIPALLGAAILTYTRASSLALLFYVVYVLLRFRKHLVRNLLVVGVMVGLLVLLAPEDYWNRMKTMAHFVDPEESAGAPVDWRRSEDINSANSRLNYWKAGLDMFTNHPILGIGLSNFTLLIARYIPGEFHVTHNTYLQLLAETGLMGFLLFMTMLMLTFYNLSYARKYAARGEDSGRVYRFCEAARMGLFGFMICMFFISRQSYEPLYWLFTLSALCRSLVFYAPKRREARMSAEKRRVRHGKRREWLEEPSPATTSYRTAQP